MGYTYIILGLLTAAHAFSYGRWLMKNGYRFGGYVVYLIVFLAAALPLYRLATSH